MTRASTVAAILLCVGLSGCATAKGAFLRLVGQSPAKPVEVRAAMWGESGLQAPSSVDRLYERAKQAIADRDYARALDLLQLARDGNASDVRILNALAVTYDKLGRFDLSRRYYDLALQAEPGSPIVRANLDYSDALQRRQVELAAAPAPGPVANAPPPPERPYGPLQAGASGIRLALGSVGVRSSAPLLAGAPVLLVDASGAAGSVRLATAHLSGAGWSLTASGAASAPQAKSEIRHRKGQLAVAEALARTLPIRPVLAACADCQLQLILGEDLVPAFETLGKDRS